MEYNKDFGYALTDSGLGVSVTTIPSKAHRQPLQHIVGFLKQGRKIRGFSLSVDVVDLEELKFFQVAQVILGRCGVEAEVLSAGPMPPDWEVQFGWEGMGSLLNLSSGGEHVGSVQATYSGYLARHISSSALLSKFETASAAISAVARIQFELQRLEDSRASLTQAAEVSA